tara:strand:- start:121828 stop:122424 length:597 start_codon:yes stop_codon:yes gene_type:complete
MKKNTTHHRADSTRAKIVKAARKLFVKHGYAGTSMSKVTELSKVNHSLIFHHFKNKQGLWVAVKHDIVKEDENKTTATVLPATTLPFPKFIKQLVINSIDFYRNNPDIMRMIAWQRMEGTKKDIGVTENKHAKTWVAAFQHYQDAGEMTSGFPPEFGMTMTLSLCSAIAMDPNHYIEKPAAKKAYIKFITDKLITALM